MSHPFDDPTEGLVTPRRLAPTALLGAACGIAAFFILILLLSVLIPEEEGPFDYSLLFTGAAVAMLGVVVALLPASARAQTRMRDVTTGPASMRKRLRSRVLSGRQLPLDDVEMVQAERLARVALLAIPPQIALLCGILLAQLGLNVPRLFSPPGDALIAVSTALLTLAFVGCVSVLIWQRTNVQRFLTGRTSTVGR